MLVFSYWGEQKPGQEQIDFSIERCPPVLYN